MTRIEMYSAILRAFGADSFDIKMFVNAAEQNVSHSMLEALYKSIMKKKQGS